MSDGLARMPGHRAVESSPQETDKLLEILPFLPTDYQAAVPLYISMALLFIVVSRAARRQKRRTTRRRAHPPQDQHQPVARRRVTPTNVRRLRPHDGHWGDG